MYDIETQDRYQDAVLWPKEGTDDYGRQIVGDPIPLKVRWESKVSQVLDGKGTPKRVDAKVVVDRDIQLGSIMWEGALADLPSNPTNLHLVEGMNKTPDIKNLHYRRVVFLSRYGDTLPN